ncbi:hypothetical protein BD413DRAFT_609862 [Trametes elegans]|nr:hypothetical protein BD413DRAFT_609862 [Trametes elegans]
MYCYHVAYPGAPPALRPTTQCSSGLSPRYFITPVCLNTLCPTCAWADYASGAGWQNHGWPHHGTATLPVALPGAAAVPASAWPGLPPATSAVQLEQQAGPGPGPRAASGRGRLRVPPRGAPQWHAGAAQPTVVPFYRGSPSPPYALEPSPLALPPPLTRAGMYGMSGGSGGGSVLRQGEAGAGSRPSASALTRRGRRSTRAAGGGGRRAAPSSRRRRT